MKKRVLISGLLLCCTLWATAQVKIVLERHKPYATELSLRDADKTEDNFLLKLPVTFNITTKNVLMIMVGGDLPLDYQQTVWMFSKELSYSDLITIDKNVSATKNFKKQNPVLKKVLPNHAKMALYRTFDNGYEIVQKNAKPLLIEIQNPLPGEVLQFSLQFYVAKPEKKLPHSLFARCKPVEVELRIKN